MKSDELKRKIENSYDFSIKKSFQWIDDWTYSYIDKSNLKRFLKTSGYNATDEELFSIIRRFDLSGNGRITFDEFQKGMKSSLAKFAGGDKEN